MTLFMADLLLRQAPQTAKQYLNNAISDVDELLGDGYAKKHPELLGAYMQTCALDFGCSIVAHEIQQLQDSLRTDHPLQGETLGGISEALGAIAGAIAERE